MSKLKVVKGEETVRFNYNALDQDTAIAVRAAAVRIVFRAARMEEDAALIGADLIQVRELLPRSVFGEWLKTEFPLSSKTADKWMRGVPE